MFELVVAVVLGVLVMLTVFYLLPGLHWRAPAKVTPLGWSKSPADPQMGDLGEAMSSGSLHQYLFREHSGGRCPVVSFWWRNQRVVSICSLEAFKGAENLRDRPKVIFAKCFEALDGPNSIQSINGAEWKKRKALLYGTIRGEKLESFFGDFVQVAQETEKKWSQTGKPLRLVKEVFRMTLKAILLTMLGNIFEDDSGIESLATNYLLCKSEMDKRLMDVPPPKSQQELDFQHNLMCLRDTLRRIIKARQVHKGKDLPLLDALLTSGAPEDQVLDDMVTYLGGFHTVGNYLTWTFYYLAQHSEIQDKLAMEIEDRVGGKCGEKLKSYTLTSNSYLRQVLDESLRMSLTVSFSGQLSDQDMVLDGYHVPARTPIIDAIGVAMKNETVWEQPDRFDPNRFAPDSKHAKRGLEF